MGKFIAFQTWTCYNKISLMKRTCLEKFWVELWLGEQIHQLGVPLLLGQLLELVHRLLFLLKLFGHLLILAAKFGLLKSLLRLKVEFNWGKNNVNSLNFNRQSRVYLRTIFSFQHNPIKYFDLTNLLITDKLKS